jgi:hypothetical protein
MVVTGVPTPSTAPAESATTTATDGVTGEGVATAGAVATIVETDLPSVVDEMADEQPTLKRKRPRAKKAPTSTTAQTPVADAPGTPERVHALDADGPSASPATTADDQQIAGDAASAATREAPASDGSPGDGSPGDGGASDASSISDDDATTQTSPVPSRALVKARPITRRDTALVTRASRKLSALERVDGANALAPVVPETVILPAPRRVRATTLAPVAPRRRGRRGMVGGVLVAVVTVMGLVGALQAVAPLRAALGQSQGFAPNAALLALGSGGAAPSGPWDTSAGTTESLGVGGGAGPGVTAPGSAGIPVTNSGGGATTYTASAGKVFVSAPPIAPWPPGDPFMFVPGHPAYTVHPPSDGYYWWAFGQCTWWAQFRRRDENLTYFGNAANWAAGAAGRGYRVGSQPAPGSTVVFHGGVEGAGGAGHVAHVEAVYPGGWFLVSEMNFYWNGGGWGRVDYRFAHPGWGVAFIY